MENTALDNRIAKWLAFLGFCVSIFTWKSGTDPVDVPKYFILVIGAFSLFGIALTRKNLLLEKRSKLIVIAGVFFIMALLNSVIFSDAPLTQQLFGVLGRNLGFFTYLSLVILFLVTALNASSKIFKGIFLSLQVASMYNVFICFMELTGNELLGYNNIFNSILGTFGNPNFISAFFGIVGAVTFGYIFNPKIKFPLRFFYSGHLVAIIYLIIDSKSRQGLMILIAGAVIVFFYYLKLVIRNAIATRLFVGFSMIGLVVTFLGILNVGPLAAAIYKVSLSLRGEYWRAGLNMLRMDPWSGVGLNSYGDWYRFSRNNSALSVPGVDVVTNSSHNVLIDFAANGGFLLLLAYLLLQGLTLVSILQITNRLKKYDALLVAFIAGWVAFTLQSLVSIDHLGIAIYGWIISGVIVSYNYAQSKNPEFDTESLDITSMIKARKNISKSPQNVNVSAKAALFGILGGLVGLALAIPPFKADLDWGMAMRTGDINKVKASAMMWPQDEMRLGTAAFLFGNNKLWDEALTYSYKTLKFNPRSFATWRMILNNPRANLNQRTEALRQMQFLDPNNTSLTANLLNNVPNL